MEILPQPPATGRVFTFFRYQAVGITIMPAFIVVVAFGALDAEEKTESRSSPGLVTTGVPA